jgi:hypothetical protein
MIRESIWEGAIQLTVSSLSNVVAIFKSEYNFKWNFHQLPRTMAGHT